MILNVVDANGAPQMVCVPAPGLAADASGTISANLPLGGPFAYQQAIAAPATGVVRAGWWIVNRGLHTMTVTEDGTDPSTSFTASVIQPGAMFPPPGVGYPVAQSAILLAGVTGESFSAKVW